MVDPVHTSNITLLGAFDVVKWKDKKTPGVIAH